MALDKHGRDIIVSLHGRQLGLDAKGNLVGQGGIRDGYEAASTGSTLAPGGLSVLSGTAGGVYELHPPSEALIGQHKSLACTSGTSAAYHYVKTASGTLLTSAGVASSLTVALFSTGGQTLDLQYISTSYILVKGNLGAVTFAAST